MVQKEIVKEWYVSKQIISIRKYAICNRKQTNIISHIIPEKGQEISAKQTRPFHCLLFS